MADRGDTSLWQQLLSSRAFQNQDMSNFDRDTALNLPKRRKKKIAYKVLGHARYAVAGIE